MFDVHTLPFRQGIAAAQRPIRRRACAREGGTIVESRVTIERLSQLPRG